MNARGLGSSERLVAILFAFVLASVAVASTMHSEADAAPRAAAKPRVLGAFLGKQSLSDTTTAPSNPAKIDAFARRVGAQPRIVMSYQAWGRSEKREFNYPSSSGRGVMDEVVARGAMPVVTWTPRNPGGSAEQPAYALRTIIAGRHDAYIRRWARDAAEWGKPFYLRFAHEMNGTWQPWSPGVNGNRAAEYAAAWRHVHGIFEREGANNVRWMWSPYVSCRGCTGFKKVYPGARYVDWVALDGYNWGVLSGRRNWQSMDSLFGDSYDKVTRLAPGKPFMIAEVACAEQGGDKAAWIRAAFSKTIPQRMPKTRAVIWFDSLKERDWRVNSSYASLKAFREVARRPSYSGRLP